MHLFWKVDHGSESAAGAGGHETWRFQAVAAGEQTLKLGYQRPWASDEEPIQIYTLRVTVRD